jgi:hypothetical protein
MAKDFVLPPSPFEREHRYIDGILTNAGRARSKANDADIPKHIHSGRRPKIDELTHEQLSDVLFGRGFCTHVAARNGISVETVYRYRKMYSETGRVYGELISKPGKE